MDIADWLRQLDLEQYKAVFRDNDIRAAVLPSLTAEDLKDLGVTSVGHRRQLLEAIAALRTDASSAGNLTQPLQSSASRPSASDRSGASIPERRQISVMFCDVVGFTALSSRLDPEDLSALIRGYQSCVARRSHALGASLLATWAMAS